MSKLLDRLTALDHVRKHEDIMVQYGFRDSHYARARRLVKAARAQGKAARAREVFKVG